MDSRRIHVVGTGIGRGSGLAAAALALHLEAAGAEVVLSDSVRDDIRHRDPLLGLPSLNEHGLYTSRPARGKQRPRPEPTKNTQEVLDWNAQVERRRAEKAARKAAKGSP